MFVLLFVYSFFGYSQNPPEVTVPREEVIEVWEAKPEAPVRNCLGELKKQMVEDKGQVNFLPKNAQVILGVQKYYSTFIKDLVKKAQTPEASWCEKKEWYDLGIRVFEAWPLASERLIAELEAYYWGPFSTEEMGVQLTCYLECRTGDPNLKSRVCASKCENFPVIKIYREVNDEFFKNCLPMVKSDAQDFLKSIQNRRARLKTLIDRQKKYIRKTVTDEYKSNQIFLRSELESIRPRELIGVGSLICRFQGPMELLKKKLSPAVGRALAPDGFSGTYFQGEAPAPGKMYYISAQHVPETSDKKWESVSTGQGEIKFPVRPGHYDWGRDLVQVETPQGSWKPLDIAKASEAPVVGDFVNISGYPGGSAAGRFRVNTCQVSGYQKRLDSSQFGYILFCPERAEKAAGFSGGPAQSEEGKVFGVVSSELHGLPFIGIQPIFKDTSGSTKFGFSSVFDTPFCIYVRGVGFESRKCRVIPNYQFYNQ